MDRQTQNRYEMAIDEDYYDNIQWDDESAAILRQRGQAPLVYNVISTSVRWVWVQNVKQSLITRFCRDAKKNRTRLKRKLL